MPNATFLIPLLAVKRPRLQLSICQRERLTADARPPGEVTRPLTLRLSVTERCNFRCRYCTPPGGFPKTRYDHLLSLDRLAQMVEWLAREFVVRRVRITGGEPLVRPGVADLVTRLASISGLKEVSLTTNGSRLRHHAHPLKQAGLNRVNVSLDTLNGERFAALTGGRLSDTLAGIETAVAAGLTPVKLNAVLHSSTWREDVPALLDYASEQGLDLRFIELMPTGAADGWARAEFIAASEVMGWLENVAPVTPLPHPPASPARPTRVTWRSKAVAVGWITPVSRPFCDGCNRLRLNSHGRLRRCLMDPNSFPLMEIITTEGSDSATGKVADYLAGKRSPAVMSADSPMIALGG